MNNSRSQRCQVPTRLDSNHFSFIRFGAQLLTALLVLTPFLSNAEPTATPRVLMVSAEIGGIFQSGGLGHAAGGLKQALNAEGISTDILMPYYLQMKTPPVLQYSEKHFPVALDWQDGSPHKTSDFFLLSSNADPHAASPDSAIAASSTAEGGRTLFMKHNSHPGEMNYFDNRTPDGKKIYGPDFFQGEAFGAWARATADYILSQNYDTVILNDWHTGLVALYLDEARAQGKKVPKVIMAIHNIAFQGVFPRSLLNYLGIPDRYFSTNDGIEFHGQANFLKAGMQYSDLTYTVSSTYAEEISTPLFGAGLDGLVRRLQAENRETGVLNGIINREWDPARSYHPSIQWTFTADDLRGKAQGKEFLQKKFGLPVRAETPVFILTSRIGHQKGFEYLLDSLEETVQAKDAQFIIIGDGDARDIERIKALQSRFSDRVQYRPFSEENEKLMTAYGDFFVNAAWFEPSGLNQFFALKNGTLPVLTKVGGLADSIVDGETGFYSPVFWKEDLSGYDRGATAKALTQAFGRAVDLFKNNPAKITEMRRNGMREDHSWRKQVLAQILPMLKYVLAEGPRRLSELLPGETSKGKSPTELRTELREATHDRQSLACEAIF